MSFEKAEQARLAGTLPAEYESEVLPQFKEAVAAEIARAIQFFYSSSEEEVKTIVLCGGCALIPGLSEVVAKETKLPTTVADPLKNMTFAAHLDETQVRPLSASLMMACGLALRGLAA
jgi:type IV pilus assembly protein PilM